MPRTSRAIARLVKASPTNVAAIRTISGARNSSTLCGRRRRVVLALSAGVGADHGEDEGCDEHEEHDGQERGDLKACGAVRLSEDPAERRNEGLGHRVDGR